MKLTKKFLSHIFDGEGVTTIIVFLCIATLGASIVSFVFKEWLGFYLSLTLPFFPIVFLLICDAIVEIPSGFGMLKLFKRLKRRKFLKSVDDSCCPLKIENGEEPISDFVARRILEVNLKRKLNDNESFWVVAKKREGNILEIAFIYTYHVHEGVSEFLSQKLITTICNVNEVLGFIFPDFVTGSEVSESVTEVEISALIPDGKISGIWKNNQKTTEDFSEDEVVQTEPQLVAQ